MRSQMGDEMPVLKRAYYVERVGRTVTTMLVYAESATDAKRRSAMEGEPLDSVTESRGFGRVCRAPAEDDDA